MSFYFREKPRFGDKFTGKTGDDLMREFQRQFEEDKTFFEPTSSSSKTTRSKREPFERHAGFSRGFPFDDIEGSPFGRRGSDIRSHLDDLASRHPEFADHLLGTAWDSLPAFRNPGSLRRSRDRRDSGDSPSGHHQNPEEEDTRSQTSGSSASSGASGVNSHRDSSFTRRIPDNQKFPYRDLPKMDENPGERSSENRGQRSMSAPPENRQDDRDEKMTKKSSDNDDNTSNQRFVSRVDITPRFVDDKSEVGTPRQSSTSSASASSNQQKAPQHGSNVRHIPIFVEGRDEPVIAKNRGFDERESPPRFATPKYHQRPNFDEYYRGPRGGTRADWAPSFDEEFYSHPRNSHRPGVRRAQNTFVPTDMRHGQGNYRQGHGEGQRWNREDRQERPHSASPQQQKQSAQHPRGTEDPRPESPPKVQKQPKDPLEKVAEVQREVDSLNEQVTEWSGVSRKDKTWIYLDEMLTRELIKLDDIETEGKENVRQARKTAIKSIQDSISLLESKAPLPTEKTVSEEEKARETPQEMMELEKEAEEPEDGVSKVKEDERAATDERNTAETPAALPAEEKTTHEEISAPEVTQLPSETAMISTDVKNVDGSDVSGSAEDRASSRDEARTPEVIGNTTNVAKTEENSMETMMDVEKPVEPETAKKVRRTKRIQQQQQQQRQPPIAEGAIPLPPPPETRENDAAK